MRELIEQVKAALDAELSYLSLFASLAIPDICGAMSAQDGKANSRRYKHWFDQYVAHKYVVKGEPWFTSDDCYYFRCAYLHLGSTRHPRSTYERIVFTERGPAGRNLHNNRLPGILNLDINEFCGDILEGAASWLQANEGTEPYETNFQKSIRRDPDGLRPFITGISVIG